MTDSAAEPNAVPGEPERMVIGYIADSRGYDALALGAFLANGANVELVITLVLPEPNRFSSAGMASLNSDTIMIDQVREWGDDALARVPEGVEATFEYRCASTEAHGLLDAAEEHNAVLVIVGAEAGTLLRTFTVGSTANTLLHSSPVPVGLAPAGFSATGPVDRVTGIYGTRAGSEAVIGRALQRADSRGVPLRLVSLVQIDGVAPRDIPEITDEVREFGGSRLEKIATGMLDSGRATIEIAEGRDFDEALESIEWHENEFAVVGSSRLGRGRSVFLGSRARRILRLVPVPVIVIPSEYTDF